MERKKRFLVPLIRGIYTTSYIIDKNITLLGIIMFVMMKSAIQVPLQQKLPPNGQFAAAVTHRVAVVDTLFDDSQVGVRQFDVVFASAFVGFYVQYRSAAIVVGVDVVNAIAALLKHSDGFGTVLFKIFVAVNLVFDVIVGTCDSSGQSDDGGQ